MEAKRTFRRLACAVALPALAAVAFSPPAGAQTDAAPRAKSTAVEGVVITAARRSKPVGAPPPLEDFAAPPRFEQVSISPDGEQIAFITTIKGMRLLVARRMDDKAVRAVKLDAGEISSLSWADADHILLSATKSALRGTCNAGDEQAIQIRVLSETDAIQSLGAQPTPGGFNPAAAAQQSAIQTLQTQTQGAATGHPCVYYGVRAQSAVTEVDLNKRTGRTLGRIAGEPQNLPLGPPRPVAVAGKPALVGPFLELRDHTLADQPVERVYLWNIDPKGGLSRILNDGGGDIERRDRYVDDWLVSARGEILARSLYDFRAGNVLIQVRRNGGWKPILTRPILAKDHSFGPYLVGLGHDDASVVILDAAPGADAKDAPRTFHYYELSADGARSGPLDPDGADLDRPVQASDTGRVRGFLRAGAGETYAMRDPDLQALYQQALDAIPGETVRIVDAAADPHRMILFGAGQEDPGAYYYVDFATGKNVVIGDDYPQIPSEWFAPQSEITYPAADGQEIHALLTLPRKAKAQNLPIIVLPHDGLQAHDRPGFDWLAQALASRGYLVLQPNVRGSDGYGPAYIQAGLGQLGRKSASDLSDGVRYLAAQGLADPKRACVLGIGWGGYQAMAAAESSATWRCVGAINGVFDPATYAAWLKDQQVKPEQDLISPLVADPQWPRAFVANPASPAAVALYAGADGAPAAVRGAGAVAAPVLLIGAAGDKTVPPAQGDALRQALRAAGKPVQVVAYKGADHALTTAEARLATLTALMDFLAKTNPAN
jgi:dipeptidyl aminopeptidase/acylaminoacyl peptidase